MTQEQEKLRGREKKLQEAGVRILVVFYYKAAIFVSIREERKRGPGQNNNDFSLWVCRMTSSENSTEQKLSLMETNGNNDIAQGLQSHQKKRFWNFRESLRISKY